MRSFEETARLDDSLHQLAFYEVTEGKIYLPKNVEDMVSLHQKVAKKFNYYKDLIHRGDCSFDMLRNDILGQYGPFPQSPKLDPSDPKFFEKREEQEVEKKSFEGEAQEMESMINNLLKNFLPGIDITKVKLIDSSQVSNADSKIKIEDLPESPEKTLSVNNSVTPSPNLFKPKKNRKKSQ